MGATDVDCIFVWLTINNWNTTLWNLEPYRAFYEIAVVSVYSVLVDNCHMQRSIRVIS